MVMVRRSEQLFWRQFGKARTDCCESLKPFSVALNLHFTYAAALLEGNLQASTWSDDFISSFWEAFLWEPHFHFLSRTSAPIFIPILPGFNVICQSGFQTGQLNYLT